MKNIFIAVDGIDGAGKDTQIERLISWIKDDNDKTIGDKYSNIWLTREPTGITPSGKKFNELIRSGEVDPILAGELNVRDKQEHSVIIKSMLEHSIVVTSRFDIVALAYQSIGGKSIEELYEMLGFERGECLKPDLDIVFDLPAEVAYERVQKRGEKLDCFEKLEFLKKARDNFLIAIEFLKTKGRNIIVIDASKTKDEVTASMIEEIKNFYIK